VILLILVKYRAIIVVTKITVNEGSGVVLLMSSNMLNPILRKKRKHRELNTENSEDVHRVFISFVILRSHDVSFVKTFQYLNIRFSKYAIPRFHDYI